MNIGLISKSDVKNQDPANPAYRKYFYHGIGHYLGLDVHDIGTPQPAGERRHAVHDRTRHLY